MDNESFPKFRDLRIEENYVLDLKSVIEKEFCRLKGGTYVDHAATALYSEEQINSNFSFFKNSVLGNPHSRHIPSDSATQGIDAIRSRILEHFNTTHEEYDVIFTSGATEAIKIVGENFVWSQTQNEEIRNHTFMKNGSQNPTGSLVYSQENHTSILGLREYATAKGANVYCFQANKLKEILEKEKNVLENHVLGENEIENALFAYSAQCNYSGTKYSLSWIKKVQSGELNETVETKLIPINSCYFENAKEKEKSTRKHRQWFVLLDAASFVATSPLDLSKYKPDFVPISFYKMFGYPTGLGCLLVYKRAWNALNTKYFGGGTVEMVDSRTMMVKLRSLLHDRFEDGTLPFLSILSLEHGFNTLNRITGGMKNIEHHVYNVAHYFHHNLASMRHGNNKPIAEIYSESQLWRLKSHGPIVNFNIINSEGIYIGYSQVEQVSSLYNIYLRTGCVCNSGACQRYLDISTEKLKSQYKAGHVCGDTNDIVDGSPTGSVRVSFGYISTYADADRVLLMIKDCFIEGSLIFDSSWLPNEGKETSSKTTYDEIELMIGDSVNGIKTKDELINIKTDLLVGFNHIFQSASHSKNAETKLEKQNTKIFSLTDIIVYPVKSCAGIKTNHWKIGLHGLEFDRQWMIVTSSGITLTQKRMSKLSLIKPSLDKEKKILELSFPGHGSVKVNISEFSHTQNGFSEANFCGGKVCGDRVKGIDCGVEVGIWLSDALQMDGLRLLRQIKGRRNKLTGERLGRTQENLSLANESQYLVIHRPSIRLLNEQIKAKGIEQPLTEDDLILRFRPNLVLDGGSSYEEDSWGYFSIGGNQFEIHGQCTRCQMICVSPETGERSREPLLTLASTRGSNMKFGVHASYQLGMDANETGMEESNSYLDINMNIIMC